MFKAKLPMVDCQVESTSSGHVSGECWKAQVSKNTQFPPGELPQLAGPMVWQVFSRIASRDDKEAPVAAIHSSRLSRVLPLKLVIRHILSDEWSLQVSGFHGCHNSYSKTASLEKDPWRSAMVWPIALGEVTVTAVRQKILEKGPGTSCSLVPSLMCPRNCLRINRHSEAQKSPWHEWYIGFWNKGRQKGKQKGKMSEQRERE